MPFECASFALRDFRRRTRLTKLLLHSLCLIKPTSHSRQKWRFVPAAKDCVCVFEATRNLSVSIFVSWSQRYRVIRTVFVVVQFYTLETH